MFTTNSHDKSHRLYTLYIGPKGNVIMNAGASSGISVGVEFLVYDSSNEPLPTPLGLLVAHAVHPSQSVMNYSANPFSIPSPAFATRSNHLPSERLRVNITDTTDPVEREFVDGWSAKFTSHSMVSPFALSQWRKWSLDL
jgi:hypothetical protein